MIKFEINPGFDCLQDYLKDMHSRFANDGTTLQQGRNEVKIMHHRGVKLCVKSFGNRNPLNRLVYSFIRPSKAERSYYYGLKLVELGIKSPEPVAWVNYYDQHRILRHSYFISLYLEHDFSLKDVFDFELSDRLDVLSSFAEWACNKLHNNGIQHKDLSPGNILIRNTGDGYQFWLIDLNRIRFCKHMSFGKRMANLKRIYGTAICVGTIAHFYSLHYRKNPIWGAMRIGVERLMFVRFKKRKNQLKRVVKQLKIA